MKKLLATLMMFCACVLPANAGEYWGYDYEYDLADYGKVLEIVVDDTDMSDFSFVANIDHMAVLIDGTTYVSLTDAATILALEPSYKDGVMTLSNENVLFMAVGSKEALANGTRTADLPAAPIKVAYEALVPLRYVAETFGANVHYEKGRVTVATLPIEYEKTDIAKLENTFYYYSSRTVVTHETMYASSVPTMLGSFDFSKWQTLTGEDQGKDYYLHGYYRGLNASGTEVFKYELYNLSANYAGNDKIATKIHDVYNDLWYDGANFKMQGQGAWTMTEQSDF